MKNNRKAFEGASMEPTSKGLLNVNLSETSFKTLIALTSHFKTNLIQKYIQSYQTVTAIYAYRLTQI